MRMMWRMEICTQGFHGSEEKQWEEAMNAVITTKF